MKTLRGFGDCGEVAAGVEFGSEEFWEQFKAVSIDKWVEKSGHALVAESAGQLTRLDDQHSRRYLPEGYMQVVCAMW